MNKAIQFGSLYIDKVPQPPDGSVECHSGPRLDIGNTVSDKEIQWLCIDNKLIADKSVCYGLTWKDLRTEGFIGGRPVEIDGFPFICRIPTIRVKEGENDERVRVAIPSTDPQDGDETGLLIERMNAGCVAPPDIQSVFWVKVLDRTGMKMRDSSWIDPEHQVRFFGNFRRKSSFSWVPVLEPISQVQIEEHVGEQMGFIMPGAVFNGRLIEVSTYDFIVRMRNETIASFYPTAKPWKGDWWQQIDDGLFAIDRTQLIHSKLV